MAERAKVLIVDGHAVRHSLRAALMKQGFTCFEALTGEDGVYQARSKRPNVVVLGLDLPDMSPIDSIIRLRQATAAPIIVVLDERQEPMRANMLALGADDLLRRPYEHKDLLALIRAVSRRNVDPAEPIERVLTLANLTITLSTCRVYRNGMEVHMTPKEYRLLLALARHNGEVVPTDQLLGEAWGKGDHQIRYVKAYMGQLRRKLGEGRARPKILGKPGIGYRLG
jgi:two-component system KDP operon response regulator KdpE